jgi:hypothetical protein
MHSNNFYLIKFYIPLTFLTLCNFIHNVLIKFDKNRNLDQKIPLK